MEQEEKEVQIGLGLHGIEFFGLNLTEIGRSLKSQPDYETYEFSFELGPLTDLANDKVIMLLKVSIMDKETKKIYGVFPAQFVFNVHGLNTIAQSKDDGTHIEIAFLRMLAGISVSTARGLLYMAAAQTKISNALIPIVDPSSFFTEESKLTVRIDEFSQSFTKETGD